MIALGGKFSKHLFGQNLKIAILTSSPVYQFLVLAFPIYLLDPSMY